MTRRALIYTRISKDKTGAGLGVERQEQDCRELAARLGWQVVGHHSDNDISAYSGKPRPGYAALLGDLQAGRADAVIVWHTDRLHRRQMELEGYIEVCQPRDIPTETVMAGAFDLATSSGRMIARILGAVAHEEVEHMIERQRAAKLQAATSGRWKGGRRPFGYEADGVTVCPAEAAEIVRATDALLAGLSLRAIARDWNARGVTTSTGGVWKPTEVRKLLARPRNAGKMEHRGEVIGAAQWPAIVAEEHWRAACALVADPTRRTTTGNARRWLGGGLYRCGVCGGTLRASTTGTGGKGRGHAPAYRREAGAHVVRRCSELDAYVEAVVIERLSRPDAARLGAAEAMDAAPLHVERLTLQTRLSELVDLFTAGTITAQQMQRGTADLRSRLEKLDQRLVAATADTALDGITGPEAAEAWRGLDLSRRRAVLDTLMDVQVHRTRRGRPPGWQPGRSYFDPRGVEITPRTTPLAVEATA